ncbi:MAG: hypothetical protein AAF125_05320, partial [Chloroflexota bacterium]
MWLFAATWALLNQRRWLVGVFAGLGLLTRPDAGIWILLVGLVQLIESLTARDENGVRTPSVPWQTWLAGALVIAPWVIISWVYYGSPIPNTIGAKSDAYVIPDYDALIGIVQRYATPFMDFDTFGSLGAMVGAVVYPLLSLIALSYIRTREPRLYALLLYPWLYAAIFAVANPLMFRWYYAPPLPAWMVGVVLGAWAIVSGIANAEKAPGRARIVQRVAAGGLALLWGGTSLNHWVITPDHGPQRPAPEMAWHVIELNYRTVGNMLREEYGVTSDTPVAAADIGAVGYYSQANIIDTVGLITPAFADYYPFDEALLAEGQNYAVPPGLILSTQPEYFVTMEGFVREGLLTMPDFTDNYTLIEEIPMDVYGSGMQVYARNDVLVASSS